MYSHWYNDYWNTQNPSKCVNAWFKTWFKRKLERKPKVTTAKSFHSNRCHLGNSFIILPPRSARFSIDSRMLSQGHINSCYIRFVYVHFRVSFRREEKNLKIYFCFSHRHQRVENLPKRAMVLSLEILISTSSIASVKCCSVVMSLNCCGRLY